MSARVFRVDDYEWWIGDCEPEQVLEAYLKSAYTTREEHLDEHGLPRPLTDEELDGLDYWIDEVGELTRTFREQLALDIEGGVPEPRLFASTEG
jgi:hypothetical protein